MRTALVLSTCLLLGPPSLPGEEEARFRPEACFPEGVLYGSIANGARLEERLGGTLLGRIATHPGVRKAFEGFVAFVKERAGAEGADFTLAGKSPLEIVRLIRGEIALNVSITPHGLPAVALAIELGKTREEILDVRKALKAMVEEGAGSPLETMAIEGFEATAWPVWPGPTGPVLEAVLGTHLVIATRELFTSIAAAHKARPGAAEREKALDPDLARDLAVNDREALLLLDVEGLRSVLLEQVPEGERENVEKVLRVTGLDKVTSLGGALGFRDGGAESAWRLGMKDGPGGVLAALAKSLPALGDLDEALGRIPAAADEVQAGRIDIGGLLRGIDGAVRETFPEMGEHLDQAYGQAERIAGISVKRDVFALREVTAYSFSVRPPAGGLFPDDVVLVRTDSLEPSWKLLEKIGASFGARPRAIGAGGVTYLNLTDGQLVEWLRQAIVESGSQGMWTPNAPELLILMAAWVAFARADATDGWTAVSPLPQAIVRHLEARSKGPHLGGPEGAELAGILRREAKGASAVIVSRGGRSILALYNSVLPLANGFYPILKAVGIDPTELPPGETFLSDVKPGYLRLSVDPRGFTVRGHRALETRAGVLAGVGFVAMGAGFLVPVLARGRGEAYTVQCGSQLKQIYSYALVYSDKSGTRAFPHSEDGSLASLQVLVDFDSEGLMPRMFVCPAHGGRDLVPLQDGEKLVLSLDTTSYEIVPWRLKNTALNAILMYDKEPAHHGGRNVLFSDGSVQWMPENQFQKSLAENRDRFAKAKTEPTQPAPKRAAKKKAGQ